jgi:hypothetical protein
MWSTTRARFPSCASASTPTAGAPCSSRSKKFRDLREIENRYAIVTGHPTMNGERPIEVDGEVTIVQKP